jgi:type III restriction enzyme
MPASGITHLIVNAPYEEPKRHWLYRRETRTFSLEDGRRPAGYVKASESSKSFDDPGVFVPIDLVNKIRPRVTAWRDSGYPGVTGVTRRLLEHWNDIEQRDSSRRFFFCQLEAIETLIWLAEGPASDRVGVEIPRDRSDAFPRLCSKLATGTGKTVVMAMVIAWHVLNKVAYPQDDRYAKHIFVVAPGLTVRNRLKVLRPEDPENYYDAFGVVPVGMRAQLNLSKVLIRNWHVLNWETDEKLKNKRTVDKRGAKSDEAYVRGVLGELASARNLLVINDEAHHAWRVNPDFKGKSFDRQLVEEATKWVGGLDRIHKARRILQCFDFSATPFAPGGRASTEEALFDWIVSDFGLNDAIESGLVKTPRIVVRTNALPDATTYQDKLYHIYQHVREDLNRKAEPHERLPDLVSNAYYLLGTDWLETLKEWTRLGYPTPPVMITVANRVETAARVKHAFDNRKILIDELCSPERTLHIDSKVLEAAEAMEDEAEVVSVDTGADDDVDEPAERKLTKDEQAKLLRLTVDTVGRLGEPGENIQNVISVGMLTEGWDAKTVTHIMGLRAFTSQLLCEQVVGRGLRRTSYEVEKDGMFAAEYVNIFGVPFTFLPHESEEEGAKPPAPPKTRIEALKEKAQFEIVWHNILRIDHTYRPLLELDLKKVPSVTLNATDKIENAEMAAVVAGKPHMAALTEIDLKNLAERFRFQTIVFEVARDVYDQMKPTWKGSRENLLGQVIRLVEKFISSPKLKINPPMYGEDDLRRRVMLTLNMQRIVQHVFEQIRFGNTEALEPIFDSSKPIRSTQDMIPWYTGKPVVAAERSHVNLCVADSTWEAQAAYELDHNPRIEAWVKNDHLGFEVTYVFDAGFHKYRPDYIIRLLNGTMLVAEVKGMNTEKDRTKRRFLGEWMEAVNAHGGFGQWQAGLVLAPSDFPTVIEKSTAMQKTTAD